MEVCKCTKEKEIATLQSDVKTLYRKTDKLEITQDGMNELITNVAILAENMKGIKEDVADVKKDINLLKKAPAEEAKEFKRTVRNVIVTFILTAILTYILTGLGG